MRLLHTKSLTFKEFTPGQLPPYAIISHRWGLQEITYQDLVTGNFNHSGDGYRKLKGACWLAQRLKYPFEWIWFDSCCINKQSSTELSEAINSMFQWYANANVCLAYLHDVPGLGDCRRSSQSSDPRSEDRKARRAQLDALCKSEWFTRGWTLQELIAPSYVDFYDRDFGFIGSRSGLCEDISEVTGIDVPYLNGQRAYWKASIATRLSWASRRSTTRIEDQAYSLLGLLQVNLPLLYGEGVTAFFRLQQAIIASSCDESIFAWWPDQCPSNDETFGMIARSPRDFRHSRNINRGLVDAGQRQPFHFTNKGLQFSQRRPKLEGYKFHSSVKEQFLVLACEEVTYVPHRTAHRVVIAVRKVGTSWYRVKGKKFLTTPMPYEEGKEVDTYYIVQPNRTDMDHMREIEIFREQEERVEEQKRLRRRTRAGPTDWAILAAVAGIGDI